MWQAVKPIKTEEIFNCDTSIQHGAPGVDNVTVKQLCNLKMNYLLFYIMECLHEWISLCYGKELNCTDSKRWEDFGCATILWPLMISLVFAQLLHSILAPHVSCIYSSSKLQWSFELVNGITADLFTLLSLLRHDCLRIKLFYIVSRILLRLLTK